ncbi:Hypothetical_protein [Hexamita inflata]|uniref:Hypothetical_protein n=1 Tax=Hexamita inflata TaxID=28002 RepID=A0AA86QFC7_9EUKA|nr:Hypothetical protein HINF_LOCUS41633 [Hexamita inflata]
MQEVIIQLSSVCQYLLTDTPQQIHTSLKDLKHQYSEVDTQQFNTTYDHGSSDNENNVIQKIPLREQFVEQKRRFAEILAQVLKEYNIQSKMCTYVDICIQEHGQKRFWTSMNQLMPEKTVKQLRDNYHRSFQKVMYNTKISFDDKRILRKLIRMNDQLILQITQ